MSKKMLSVKFDNDEIIGTYGAIVELGYCYSKLALTFEKEGFEAMAEYYRSKQFTRKGERK